MAELAPAEFVLAYPNPAVSQLTLECPSSLLGSSFSIFDKLGQVVIKGKFSELQNSIEIGTLSPGIYFIRLDDDQRNLLKLVKM